MWSGLSPGVRQQFTYPDPGRDQDTSSEDGFKKVCFRPMLYKRSQHFQLAIVDALGMALSALWGSLVK